MCVTAEAEWERQAGGLYGWVLEGERMVIVSLRIVDVALGGRGSIVAALKQWMGRL